MFLMKLQTGLEVPSLYVRVYRCSCSFAICCLSSLTIREGVSQEDEDGIAKRNVPSLYVRVCRANAAEQRAKQGSLTIREGVSL